MRMCDGIVEQSAGFGLSKKCCGVPAAAGGRLRTKGDNVPCPMPVCVFTVYRRPVVSKPVLSTAIGPLVSLSLSKVDQGGAATNRAPARPQFTLCPQHDPATTP
jgi:hypothetical protein